MAFHHSSMTKKKKNVLLIALCALTMAVAGLCAFNVTRSAASPDDGWSPLTVAQEYKHGEIFTVEDRCYYENGKEYPASVTVTLPSGETTAEKNIALEDAGTYTLEYSVITDAGELRVERKTFLVNYPVYSYHSPDTSVSYGKGKYAAGNEEGMMVRLAAGDSIQFTNIVDLADITKSDTLFSCYITPDARGVEDFKSLIITMTDAENPDVFVRIKYWSYIYSTTNGGNSYASASGNGQVFTGLHASSGLRVNDNYGPFTGASFIAQRNGESVASDAYLITLRFDPETATVYCCGQDGLNTFCIDLDNGEYFKNLWTGFESGKVRFSVSAADYVGTTANFCILSVFGVADAGEMAEVAQGVYKDEQGPDIQVKGEYAYDALPNAVVGNSYTVPTAEAYDRYSGKEDVTCSVWYNYNTDRAISVPVIDGKFYVDKAGGYAIVYQAKDDIGNLSTKVCWVNAFESLSPIDFLLPESRVTSAGVGQYVALEGVEEFSGGSGNKTVRISVTDPNGNTVTVTDGFRTQTPGVYTVTYTAIDYVGQEKPISYTLEVADEDSLVLESIPAFYPVYISGATYTLPEIYAYHYTDGELNRVLCSVKVKYGNRKLTYTSGDEFVPSVKNNGDQILFDVIYDGEVIASYEADVILAYELNEYYGDTELKEGNYFHGEGFEKTPTGTGVVFKATQNTSFSWIYANALDKANLSITFFEVANMSERAKITVTLSDVADMRRSVSLVMQNAGEGVTYLQVGGATALLGVPFSAVGDKNVISFKNDSFYCSGVQYSIAYDDNGNEFEGFVSDEVFISVAFENQRAGASYTVSAINGYVFKNNYENYAIPEINIHAADYGGRQSLGTVYRLPAASASDVFAPTLRFYVTVYENNSVMYDVNGKLLYKVDPTQAYDILLSDFGRYTVQYYAEAYGFDGAKKVNDFTSYAINVYDNEPPVITVTGSYKGFVSVGEEMSIPSYTVSDNSGGEMIHIITIRRPDGRTEYLTEGKYTATMVGEYEFRLMVVDEIGNTAMKRFSVQVS